MGDNDETWVTAQLTLRKRLCPLRLAAASTIGRARKQATCMLRAASLWANPRLMHLSRDGGTAHPMAGLAPRNTSQLSVEMSMCASVDKRLVMAIACTSSGASRKRRVTRPWRVLHTPTTHWPLL